MTLLHLHPLRLHRQPPPSPRGHSDGDPATEPPSAEPGAEQAPSIDPQRRRRTAGKPVRVGAVGLRSAASYLLLWMLVLLAVEVLVFWVGYLLLDRLGVLESVSAAAAAVLGDPVPESGVLPALELSALLPWAVVAGSALAVLCLVMSLAMVLVHNAICAITGGPKLQVR